MDPTQAIRETNLVLQLKEEIKSKTEMSWNSRMKKEFILFCVNEVFFNIRVLCQCIRY